jgi:hypothetical protein
MPDLARGIRAGMDCREVTGFLITFLTVLVFGGLAVAVIWLAKGSKKVLRRLEPDLPENYVDSRFRTPLAEECFHVLGWGGETKIVRCGCTSCLQEREEEEEPEAEPGGSSGSEHPHEGHVTEVNGLPIGVWEALREQEEQEKKGSWWRR